MTTNKKMMAEFNKELMGGHLKSVCEDLYPAIGGYTAQFYRDINTYDGGWLLATDSTGPASCKDYAIKISETEVNLAYDLRCDPCDTAAYAKLLLELSDSIRAIAETRGRPPALAGGKKVTVYLDDTSLAAAATLGNGNVSEGIRSALKAT